MTDEELDEARAREALQRHNAKAANDPEMALLGGFTVPMATIAARLARENWRPVDPDLLEAREIWARDGAFGSAELARPTLSGDRDDSRIIRALVAAIRRGRELERGQ